MKTSLTVIDRKAVKAALEQNWQEAVELNLEILNANPNDINAKIRLGKAYMQTAQFPKAKKIFKEILEIDPLNQIALKNYECAKSGKVIKDNHNGAKHKIILKEPGTTREYHFTITEPKVTANHFTKGDDLELKVLKKSVQVYQLIKEKRIFLGNLDEPIASKLIAAHESGAEVSALYMHGESKNLTILLKSSTPIFRGQKQDVKPYVKSDGLDYEDNEEQETEVEE